MRAGREGKITDHPGVGPLRPATREIDVSEITVYWRPMCGYCEVLKGELTARGVPFRMVDIWADRSQADVVKGATGGDEIVPTVQIGDRFLVNPSADEVLAAAAA